MFKKFTKSTKFLSLILALVMVFGFTSGVFAATGDGILDVWAVNGSVHAEMEAVTVGEVTRYTGYIEFPENSTQDLSDVAIQASLASGYTLKVDGANYSTNMSVDFSNGYVDFTVSDSNGNEFRNYQINAGIKGKNQLISVSIDLTNANDWLAGTYASGNSGGYVVPLASSYPLAADRVKKAVDGLESGSIEIEVVADIGESAMDVFSRAAGLMGLNVVGLNTGYVSEIGRNGVETLPDLLFQKTYPVEFPASEWDKDRTGWIYLMNGEVSNMGASQYKITSIDEELTWGYTFDWGIDLGGPEW